MHEQFLARQKQAKGLEKQAEAEEKKDSEFTTPPLTPSVSTALWPWPRARA